MTAYSVDLSKATVSSCPRPTTAIEDDFKRELSFYHQALQAASTFRSALHSASKLFSRPSAYFADMFKNTGHMQQIQRKKTAALEASEKAQASKQLRMNKKLGKAVQQAREQEKHAQKRAAVASIEQFKKKRKTQAGNGAGDAEEEFDAQFTTNANANATKSAKRKAKDAKHGFGGKKWGLKRNDAKSAADDSTFSQTKMKAPFGKGSGKVNGKGNARASGKPKNRPGKVDRAKSGQAKVRAAAGHKKK